MFGTKYRRMKEVLKTLSLASVLCSQVSMTLYNKSAPGSSPHGSENMTAVEGEEAIFRLTSQQIINYILWHDAKEHYFSQLKKDAS